MTTFHHKLYVSPALSAFSERENTPEGFDTADSVDSAIEIIRHRFMDLREPYTHITLKNVDSAVIIDWLNDHKHPQVDMAVE